MRYKERTCEHCGETYRPEQRQPHQKYCSEQCKRRSRNRRMSAKRKARYHSDPEYRRREIERVRDYQRSRMERDPEYRERRRAYWRERDRREKDATDIQ